MYLAQLLRGYILLVVGKLLAPPPAQQVFNSSLPSVCTSQIVNPYLAQVPAGAWRKAFGRDDASSIIDISIPLGRGTVDWERCGKQGVWVTMRHVDQVLRPFQHTAILVWMPRSARWMLLNSWVIALQGRFCACLRTQVCRGVYVNVRGRIHSAHSFGYIGTHIDSPGHFVWDAYASGKGMESLDLEVLNGTGVYASTTSLYTFTTTCLDTTGPALVVEVAADTNLTAAAVEQLNIPHGVTRVLFKTLNTRRYVLCVGGCCYGAAFTNTVAPTFCTES